MEEETTEFKELYSRVEEFAEATQSNFEVVRKVLQSYRDAITQLSQRVEALEKPRIIT